MPPQADRRIVQGVNDAAVAARRAAEIKRVTTKEEDEFAVEGSTGRRVIAFLALMAVPMLLAAAGVGAWYLWNLQDADGRWSNAGYATILIIDGDTIHLGNRSSQGNCTVPPGFWDGANGCVELPAYGNSKGSEFCFTDSRCHRFEQQDHVLFVDRGLGLCDAYVDDVFIPESKPEANRTVQTIDLGLYHSAWEDRVLSAPLPVFCTEIIRN